jgi:signal transduction histidine kinase
LGSAPGDVAYVFEPFFTTGRSIGGTGLGLAIVSNIVTAMLKGRITVRSEPGQGASFKLAFPKRIVD